MYSKHDVFANGAFDIWVKIKSFIRSSYKMPICFFQQLAFFLKSIHNILYKKYFEPSRCDVVVSMRLLDLKIFKKIMVIILFIAWPVKAFKWFLK